METCTCHACTVTPERILQGLDASDALVIKAASIGKVAQIARIEAKLRDLYYKKWNQRQLQAVKTATTLFRNGKTAKQISAAVRKIMILWADDVARRAMTDIKTVYTLAREAGFDKAAGRTKGSLTYGGTDNFTAQVSKAKKVPAGVGAKFDLVDTAAVEAIQMEQMYWIGDFYDIGVAEAIQETTAATVIEAGANRAAAAKTLADRVAKTLSHVTTPGGFRGSTAQYFEGLVANAVTNARVQGQVRSFTELEVTRYEIVNPSDRRTCPVCEHVNGKTFSITHAVKQMEADMDAAKIGGEKGKTALKDAHPWLKLSELLKISPKPGPLSGKAGAKDEASLAEAGQALPPFHFRCRCTVDVA